MPISSNGAIQRLFLSLLDNEGPQVALLEYIYKYRGQPYSQPKQHQ